MGFDADKFLNQSTDQAMATVMAPCPEGEYEALIENVEAFPIKDKNTGQERDDTLRLQVTWNIIDQALLESIDRPKITVRQAIFIDLDESGAFAHGKDKNVSLGKLRAAVRQNDSGPWSPASLVGAGPALVRVTHRPNKDDDSMIYAEIRQVTAI